MLRETPSGISVHLWSEKSKTVMKIQTAVTTGVAMVFADFSRLHRQLDDGSRRQDLDSGKRETPTTVPRLVGLVEIDPSGERPKDEVAKLERTPGACDSTDLAGPHGQSLNLGRVRGRHDLDLMSHVAAPTV